MMEKKKLSWWMLLVAVAAGVCIGGAILRLNAPPDPHKALAAALAAALDGASFPESPASLGVLGQGEIDGTRFGVSGNLNLQADEDGLALSLSDFTLADEDGSTDIEVYINKDAAALRLPGMTGEEWYGVDLSKPLRAQAVEAVGEELAEWYFGDEALEQAQSAADEARAGLAEIRKLGLSEGEIGSLKAFFARLEGVSRRLESGEGYLLQFSATAEQVEQLLNDYNWRVPYNTSEPAPADSMLLTPQDTVFTFHVDKNDRLTYVAVTTDDRLFLALDLGDPEEPTPRLELNWGEDGENSLELAFTLSAGQPLAAPDYIDAFGLVAALAADGN